MRSPTPRQKVTPAVSPGGIATPISFTFTPRVDCPFSSGWFHFHLPMCDDKAVPTVHIEDRTDRWRFTCPNGHRSWEPTNYHFWCAKCARQKGVDGVFHELRDRREDRLVARENVRLMTPVGPYDRDLDRRGSA